MFRSKCDNANCEPIYSTTYDNYYCLDCNKWLESLCNDTNCCKCINMGSETPKELMKVKRHYSLNLGFTSDTKGMESFEKLLESKEFKNFLNESFGIKYTGWTFNKIIDSK